MPDIVVHNAMGDKVLERLSADISSKIDRDIFRVSLMGPDPYGFYRFFAVPLRHGVNKRSSIMHQTNMNLFLMELAMRSQSREMFSFLCGFLCHYVMDATAHPFICEVANDQGDMHMAIEHRLDCMELERQGKERKDIMCLFPSKLKPPSEVRSAIKTVFGWDDNCYAAGLRHMKLYHWVAKDQHGLLNGLLHRFPGTLSVVSYQTNKADELDLQPFLALEAAAVEQGVQLITAVHQFVIREIREDELRMVIENHSYHDG